MGILFALLASLSAAIGFTALKKSYDTFPPSVAFFLDMVLGLCIWLPYSLIKGVNFSSIGPVFGFAFLSAILSEAYVFYVMSKGELSITGTIFASYPVYTIFFSMFINHERFDTIHWILIGLIILGTIIVSLPKKINRKELKKKLVILWGISGAIAVGLSDSLSKNVIDKTSAANFLFALSFMQIPVALVYLRLEKQTLSQFNPLWTKFDQYKYSLIGSLGNVLCVFFLWLAFEATYASIASPLTATYPAIMLITSYLFLKEKVSKKDICGLIIVIIGIIGISYFYQ